MFSPIKNFITYIQKNASGNSIFGGNCATEGSAEIETENNDTATVNANMETANEFPKEIDKEDNIVRHEENICERTKDDIPDIETTSTVSAEKSCDFEDDIETLIERSIMLKTPVTAEKGSDILELRKSSNADFNIAIRHDNNLASDRRDDELDDFKHDPMELLGTTSPPCSYQHADEFCSVGSADEAVERDFKTIDEHSIEYEDDNRTQDEQKELVDSELEVDEEEKDVETENEQNDVIEVEDEEEEPFLDLKNFKSK